MKCVYCGDELINTITTIERNLNTKEDYPKKVFFDNVPVKKCSNLECREIYLGDNELDKIEKALKDIESLDLIRFKTWEEIDIIY